MPIISKLLQISEEKGKLMKRKSKADREEMTLDVKTSQVSEWQQNSMEERQKPEPMGSHIFRMWKKNIVNLEFYVLQKYLSKTETNKELKDVWQLKNWSAADQQ